MTVVGVPKEIKEEEYRVALVPAVVEELTNMGHDVLVESGAGVGSGIMNQEYENAGARCYPDAETIWEESDIIVKVKEPLEEERNRAREDQLLFTFFHFAASRELTEDMIDAGSVCMAYETLETDEGNLPILKPMSEVAGRMAVQEGAKYLEKPLEGRGILLSGVPGVKEAHVVIIGGGTVGSNAAKIAAGLGATVVVLDVDIERLRTLENYMPANVSLLASNPMAIRDQLKQSDLVVGAVLSTGARAPVLVKKSHLGLMKEGSVIVDVAVDQGGCVETAKPTTHSDPIYTVDGVVHYCVANMPGAVGRTSTYALSNAVSPYLKQILSEGWKEAARRNKDIKQGLNIIGGEVCHRAVARSHDMNYTPVQEFL